MTKSIKTLLRAERGKVRLLLGDQFSRNNAILTEVTDCWRSNEPVCVRYFGEEAMLVDRESRVFYELGVERSNASDSWFLAQAQILSQEYRVMILLDFAQVLFDDRLTRNSSLRYGDSEPILPSHVVDWLLENKPPDLRLLISGEDAHDELREYADEVAIFTSSNTKATNQHRRNVESLAPTDLSALSPNIAEFLSLTLQSDDLQADPDFVDGVD